MELVTVGREHYPGYEITLYINLEEDFSTHSNLNSRFRLIFATEGTGVIRITGRRVMVISPTILCLNETDLVEAEKIGNLKARALYFHPKLINSIFDFKNIRESNNGFSETEYQDSHTLRAFINRTGEYFGQLDIGPATARRISILFDMIHKETREQPDNYWPCRSRSSFLELLYLIASINHNPGTVETIVLPDTTKDVEQIILYLHSNYQNKITLGELSREFHLNRTTLIERFSEVMGVSVITYLTSLRIHLASVILRDTELPISEITDKVGFNDVTHFGRVFRKYTGLTPREYREKYCWMLENRN